jgi:hypothetical protein
MNAPSLSLMIGAMVGAGALVFRWADEQGSKDAFKEQVLDSGMAEGFEDTAWEIWKMGRKHALPDRKRFHRLESQMKECERLYGLVVGLRKVGMMIKDPTADPFAKRVILIHWMNELIDFIGVETTVVASDLLGDLATLAPPTEREAGLRKAVHSWRKSALFWKRTAEECDERLENRGAA